MEYLKTLIILGFKDKRVYKAGKYWSFYLFKP